MCSERNINIGHMAQEYLKRKYRENYLNIFTDRSKQSDNEQVGLGIYITEFDKGINKSITNRLSIYTVQQN